MCEDLARILAMAQRVPIEEVAAALGVEVEAPEGAEVASLASVLHLVNPTRRQESDGRITVLIDVDKVWKLADRLGRKLPARFPRQ